MPQTNSNSSTPADAGKATISSFRYTKGYCIATLDNGVTGVIGSNTDMPLSTMLTIKGQSIMYKHVGSKDGYERYQLEFAL